MNAGLKSLGDSRFEDFAGLIDVERTTITKDVDPCRIGSTSIEHLPTHKGDVIIGTILVFGGYDMCTEVRHLIYMRTGNPQGTHLVVS